MKAAEVLLLPGPRSRPLFDPRILSSVSISFQSGVTLSCCSDPLCPSVYIDPSWGSFVSILPSLGLWSMLQFIFFCL